MIAEILFEAVSKCPPEALPPGVTPELAGQLCEIFAKAEAAKRKNDRAEQRFSILLALLHAGEADPHPGDIAKKADEILRALERFDK